MQELLKTLEEHCEYVEGLARVSFFFARKWLAPKFPEKKISKLILDHTPLLYHGLNYLPEDWQNNPECQEILFRADRLASLSPEKFEETLWSEIKESAEKRAELNYPNSVGVKAPASWNCGSLKYDPPKEGQPEGWVTFHIANSVGPHSIFEDKEYLALCFMLLMKEAQISFNANVLYTGTWLNENERFLAYFPQEYLDNLSPRPAVPPVPQWHFGCWGQIVTRRGTINSKAEKFVRENGYLKYICRASHCSFENMRRHLKEKFFI